tara:strand:+ start:2397 stop:2600 length:204 start_codon:yes stop_codon:yes gene_type:complete
MMTAEFFVDLQDANGTCYGTTDPWTDETLYFDNLDDARMYAKSQLDDEFILARVIADTNRVVDFFKR